MNSIFNIFYPRRPPAFFKKQFYNGGRRWRLGQFRTERLFVTLLVRDSNHSPTPENPGANNTSLIYLGGNPVISNSVPSASKSSFLRRRKQINIIYTQTLEKQHLRFCLQIFFPSIYITQVVFLFPSSTPEIHSQKA